MKQSWQVTTIGGTANWEKLSPSTGKGWDFTLILWNKNSQATCASQHLQVKIKLPHKIDIAQYSKPIVLSSINLHVYGAAGEREHEGLSVINFVHVVDEVNDSVAVAKLIVVPETRQFYDLQLLSWDEWKQSYRQFYSLVDWHGMAGREANTHHETSLTKVGLSWIPAPASKMEDLMSPRKSCETTWSSVYPIMPLRDESAAALTVFLISSYVVWHDTRYH